MSYDAKLAERVRALLASEGGIVEKKMFGGLAFLLFGNMCCGVLQEELIVRVPLEETDRVLNEAHTRAFDFTGRPMRGWVVVEPAGFAKEATLARWIERCLAFASTLPAK